VGDNLDDRRVCRGSRARAGGDRAWRRLPGQSGPAPLGAVFGRCTLARHRARRAETAPCGSTSRRRLGGRLGVPRALPRTARQPDLDDADQGDSARGRSGGAPELGEGCGGARHDRRPRAQRPLAGLRGGERPVAGADGDAGARRRRAHGLDRRGHASRGCGARRDPRGDVPRWVGDRRAEDRRRRPDRGARAGRARHLDGIAWARVRQRRPRPRAHDPDLRGGRGLDPPLGRGRRRLGLGPGCGGRGVVDEGAPAPRRDRRTVRRGDACVWR